MSEQLKHRMNAYAVTPPENAWNNINQQLHEQKDTNNLLADKMQAYEVAPPEDAWKQIEDQLHETPVRSISSRPFRWVAAAIITTVLLLGANYLLNLPNNEQNSSTANSSTNSTDLPNDASAAPYKEQVDTDKPVSNQRTLLATTARSSYTTPNHERTILVERPLRSSNVDESDIEPIATELPINVNPRKILNENGEVIQDMSVVNPDNDKYISITAPNGQQTKISSKLAIAMKYLSTQGSTDVTISSSDTENWKRLITEWRSRIMQSAYVPSSFNFMDILELSELIKE